jgi:Mn2+/Fe2+ NRAMP family transporter
VLNGIISPVILFFIVKISSREDVMGEFKNKKFGKLLGWIITGFLFVISVTTLVLLFL